MNDRIVNTIRKLLNLDPNGDEFKDEILLAINGAIFVLFQNGFGTDRGFVVDDSTTWSDYLPPESTKNLLEAAKNFIWLKVRLVFDPPGTSYLIDAMERQIEEWLWRIEAQIPPIEPSIEPRRIDIWADQTTI